MKTSRLKPDDLSSSSDRIYAAKQSSRAAEEESKIAEGDMFRISEMFNSPETSSPSSNPTQARRRSSLELLVGGTTSLVGGTTSALGNLGSMVASVGFADEEDTRSPSNWHRREPSTRVGMSRGRDWREEGGDVGVYHEEDNEGRGTQI